MPYEKEGDSFFPVGHIGFPTYPDGGLRTSVPDLARFLLMFQQGGELEGTRILAEATVQEMSRDQVPDLEEGQGLIWFYDDIGPREDVLGHDGEDPGTSSMMFYDPHDGSGVILVANGDWYDPETEESPEAYELMARLFTEAAAY